MNFNSTRLSLLEQHFSSIPIDGGSNQVRALLQPIIKLQQTFYRPSKQISFFGAFKAGKSTLINAILGEAILPSRANRATGVTTKISYSEQRTANVIRRVSETSYFQESIGLNEIAKYIFLDTSGTTAKAADGIEMVSIQMPLPILKNHCILIDTPGLMDNQILTQRVYQELEKSDIAVMVLSAEKLLSQVERDAAKRVNDLLNGNILFIVNRLDLVDEEDRREVLDWARSSLAGLGNSLVGQPRVFATQGKGALIARTSASTQSASLIGLVAFEQWLENLLNSPTGEKVVILSRLGILEACLNKALSYFQTQHTEVLVALQSLIRVETEAHAQQLVNLRKAVVSARRNLSNCQGQLDQMGKAFVSTYTTNVETLMASNQESSEKLKDCFASALQSYSQDVHKRVSVAVSGTNLKAPPFNISQSNANLEVSVAGNPSAAIGAAIGVAMSLGMDGGLISGAVGAAVGGWLGKKFFGVDVKKKTLEAVEQSAQGLLSVLRVETENYLNKVDSLLVNLNKSNEQNMQLSPNLKAMQQTEQYWNGLINWVNEFQVGINNIKKELTK